MADWTLAQVEASDALTRLHYFTMTKRQGDRGIEFLITVRETVPGEDRSMQFLAQADKQTRTKPLARRTLRMEQGRGNLHRHEVVLGHRKGGLCDPTTQTDAGGTPAS